MMNLKRIAMSQRERGDLVGAVNTLQQAIEQNHDNDESADLYGILGGTLRDRGDLVASARAYDAGFQLETSGRSSYNALNRLVTRIMLEPHSIVDARVLQRHEQLESVDVARELELLQARLEQQVD